MYCYLLNGQRVEHLKLTIPSMGMITVWDTISLMGYIHPTFVKTISAPQRNKKKHFAQMQESGRKDVERAFGVLQSRYVIVRGPARY